MSPDRDSLARARGQAEERMRRVRIFVRHVERFTGVGKPPHVVRAEGAEIIYSMEQTEKTLLHPAKVRHNVDIVTADTRFRFSPGGYSTILVRQVFSSGLGEPVSTATFSPVQTDDLMQYLGAPDRNPDLLRFVTELSTQEQEVLHRQTSVTPPSITPGQLIGE